MTCGLLFSLWMMLKLKDNSHACDIGCDNEEFLHITLNTTTVGGRRDALGKIRVGWKGEMTLSVTWFQNIHYLFEMV